MKTIAFYSMSESWGGLEINLYKFMSWLLNTGYQVVFLGPDKSKTAQHLIDVPGFKIVSIKAKNTRANPFLAKEIASHCKHAGATTLFIGQSKDIQTAILSKWLFNPKIKTVYLQQMDLGVDKKDILHTLFYRKLDYWITPLERLKKQVLEKTKVKESQLRVIPLCLDTASFSSPTLKRKDLRTQLNYSDADFVIGLFGRIDPGKDQETLIRAVVELRKQGNLSVKALIVGEETYNDKRKYLKKLQDLVKESGAESYIQFEPFSTNIADYFGVIDCFAMCSIAETFGMVTVEAMSAGTLVIGAKAGGTEELIKDKETGYHFEVGNYIDLANCLEDVIKHPEEKLKIEQKAKETAQALYDKNRWLEDIQSIIEKND